MNRLGYMAQGKAFAVRFDALVAMASEECEAFNFMVKDALFIHKLKEMGYAWFCWFQLTYCLPFC